MIYRMILAAALSTTMTSTGFAQTSSSDAAATLESSVSSFVAPDDAWRTVDPENLMIISTKYGDIGVELYPEIAPNHVTQVKALTRQGFYNDVPFHRVIKDFMNQTGDGSKGDGSGDSELPDIPPEFEFKRSTDMSFTELAKQQNGQSQIGVGFYKSLPIASQPSSQALWTKDGKVQAFGLHCKGVTSMARTSDPNSANSQFFLMRAKYESLDRKYSIWGNTVMGHDYLLKPLIGEVGENPEWMPDRMDEVNIAADLPENSRPKVQVLRTDHTAFKGWLETQKNIDGTLPDVCELSIPTRRL